MSNEPVVRTFACPDPIHYVETVTSGMTVVCKVYEDRGQYRIMREIFTIEKSKHRWYAFVEEFKKQAFIKYRTPTVIGGYVNRHQSGS